MSSEDTDLGFDYQGYLIFNRLFTTTGLSDSDFDSERDHAIGLLDDMVRLHMTVMNESLSGKRYMMQRG